MKKITAAILTLSFAMLAHAAGAEMIYTVERGESATKKADSKNPFADARPFYISAFYNYAMWQKMTDRPLLLDGSNDSSFDIAVGYRIYDWLRMEANYYKTRVELAGDYWALNGHTAFLNVIVDARVNHMYSFLQHQWFVPYVGAGVGVSFNNLESEIVFRSAKMDRETPMVWALMAGIAIEFNKSFAFDIGYRYMHMTAPHLQYIVDIMQYHLDDLAPVSHQFRIGARVSF